MRSPTVAIVTPWLEHRELVDDYMAAVLPELEPGDELLIVDNHSDPPLEFAKLHVSENLGFAGASNVGMDYANTDAILFLNNDIKARTRGWLSVFRDALEPGVLVGTLRYDRHADVDGVQFPYLDGWCLAGMRQDLLTLGGFDTELEEPAYYSDNLLCLKAREAGMALREIPVGLEHKLSQTARPSANPAVQAASAANRLRYQQEARRLLAFL